MQIFSASQIHQWDEYTIKNEPISSLDLMERAAGACFRWLMAKGYNKSSFTIFCGKGNNGGDGLAIARMLSINGQTVVVYILEFGHKGTDDFQQNLAALHTTNAVIRFISTEEGMYPVPKDDIIIDAIFGSGLNREPRDLNASIIKHINRSGCKVISIDIPSGLSADQSSKNYVHIVAQHTLTFQQYKLAFLMPENEEACGQILSLDIGLHPGFLLEKRSNNHLVDRSLIQRIYKSRNDFSHKGSFGHALIIAGSYGKMGAAILATNACLRSGVGLCTVHVPGCGFEIMQTSCPEAMTETDEGERYNTRLANPTERYACIGIGPGLGQEAETSLLLHNLINNYPLPLVIDADALNLISANHALLAQLPPGSILTPHPKEFERLFGKTDNDFERMDTASRMARELNIIIVLKGHFTLIATPEQNYFNTTGNSGMATGGTGDTLTGIITGLLAQKYKPEDAAVLGVYLHGLAGDIAAGETGKEALIASDLITCMGKAFLQLKPS
ncbi:NAD(P)H-hydrate dehydratase [Flavitalea antarctica]